MNNRLKFKKGDLVRFVKDTSLGRHPHRLGLIGRRGVIDKLSYYGHTINDISKDYFFTSDELELVEKAKEFKVGDKVKIVNDDLAWDYNIGRWGTVSEVRPLACEIKFEDGSIDNVFASDLELIEEDKFKVRVIADLFQYYKDENNCNDEFIDGDDEVYYYDNGSICVDGVDITDEYDSSFIMSWEITLREEVEMTLDDIESELGFKVKLVE